jgi:hypothetical protein
LGALVSWKFFTGTPTTRAVASAAPTIGEPTWFTTFDTPPKGNPYHQAAHQFMAATLNVANGASGAVINSALYNAYSFFLTANPATAWTDDQRTMLLGWSSLFGSYNEGDIGPGHCSEDETSAQ